jgi:hypothetical protein
MIFDWWHKVHAWCVSTYMRGRVNASCRMLKLMQRLLLL